MRGLPLGAEDDDPLSSEADRLSADSLWAEAEAEAKEEKAEEEVGAKEEEGSEAERESSAAATGWSSVSISSDFRLRLMRDPLRWASVCVCRASVCGQPIE